MSGQVTHPRPAPLIGRPAAQSLRNQTLPVISRITSARRSRCLSLALSSYSLHPLPISSISSHLVFFHCLVLVLSRVLYTSSFPTLFRIVVIVILALPIMKAPSLLAAALLAGGTSAEVHKLKLNKVPLEEQLVSPSILIHIPSLMDIRAPFR